MGAAREPMHEVTELLSAHAAGDRAALQRLIPLVYDDLRRIAHRHLAREPEAHTLNTTAVVHEAYVRLAEDTRAAWPDRARFFAFASLVMRHVLVDHARKRRRQKRGGGGVHVPIEGVSLGVNDPTAELIALDQALTKLAERHPRMGRVAACRLFGGMAAKEVAGALDVSLSTVERDWRAARAYLYRALALGSPVQGRTLDPEPGTAPV